jgi:hypothetical protein
MTGHEPGSAHHDLVQLGNDPPGGDSQL